LVVKNGSKDAGTSSAGCPSFVLTPIRCVVGSGPPSAAGGRSRADAQRSALPHGLDAVHEHAFRDGLLERDRMVATGSDARQVDRDRHARARVQDDQHVGRPPHQIAEVARRPFEGAPARESQELADDGGHPSPAPR